jgi:putative bacteriocin precursor
MKKLGKKLNTGKETLEAYYCSCPMCNCSTICQCTCNPGSYQVSGTYYATGNYNTRSEISSYYAFTSVSNKA